MVISAYSVNATLPHLVGLATGIDVRNKEYQASHVFEGTISTVYLPVARPMQSFESLVGSYTLTFIGLNGLY